METPATVNSMKRAPEGTVLRIGGAPAKPASLRGAAPPLAAPDGGKLLLTVGGADKEIVFHGLSAEAVAAALATPLKITDENKTLTVAVGPRGRKQEITLLVGDDVARDDLVAAINRQLKDGYARITKAPADAEADRLAIGTDVQGTAAAIRVEPNSAVGFTAAVEVDNAGKPGNNVKDLQNITAEEITALLRAAGVAAQAVLSEGQLLLSTTDTGEAAKLKVRKGDASVHASFGLEAKEPADEPVPGVNGATPKYYVKRGDSYFDKDEGGSALDTAGRKETDTPTANEAADILTLVVAASDAEGNQLLYEDLGFAPSHPRFVGNVLAPSPSRRADALENLYALELPGAVGGLALREGLFPSTSQRDVRLGSGNNDGEPTAADYRRALELLEALEDVSIVAAPGHSALTEFAAVQAELIIHVEKRRAYRVAVLDTPRGASVGDARNVRARIDSKYAPLYHPWVVVSNPLARPGVEDQPREILLPPSGFVCGIYARNDVERGVFKAPANEIVRGALRFETDINFAQQEVLNPVGVNCLRYFPGGGYRVWGARTASSDPEWKYVNVRRYFNYLEATIDRGTQWAVFEPNGERLWANIRETIGSFLYNEWVSGALLGATPKQAFFVRCDRSTMTQNDLDDGRLICLVGVAVLKPAEFVIFRIGQKTIDSSE